MAVTQVGDVQNQVQEFWSPMFPDELKEMSILASLVNKDFDGEIKKGGDTVHVSQIQRPDGEIKTVGAPDDDTFSSEKVETDRVSIVADKIIRAAVEIEDLAELQSQIGSPEGKSKIRQTLLEAVEIKLNDYLYSLVAPATSAPDHTVTGVTDFNASEVSNLGKLAAQAKWVKEGGWWLLLDPAYDEDAKNSQTLASSDFVGDDRPVVAGQFAKERFGFNMLMDNSAGLATLSGSSEDAALAFHPDFMYLVMYSIVLFFRLLMWFFIKIRKII